MADYYGARIDIGGELARRHLPRLCRLLGVGCGEELLQHLEGGHLVREDSQVCGGEFGELEEACRDLGLPYIRRSDGHWECLPELVFWQPGMEGTEQLCVNADGGILASMDTLIEVRAHLRQGRTAEALALLDGTIVEVPALPPFRIAEAFGPEDLASA